MASVYTDFSLGFSRTPLPNMLWYDRPEQTRLVDNWRDTLLSRLWLASPLPVPLRPVDCSSIFPFSSSERAIVTIHHNDVITPLHPNTYLKHIYQPQQTKNEEKILKQWEKPFFFFLGKTAKILTAQAKYQKYFLTFGQIIKLWFQIFDVLWGIPENSMGFDCSHQKDNRAQNECRSPHR